MKGIQYGRERQRPIREQRKDENNQTKEVQKDTKWYKNIKQNCKNEYKLNNYNANRWNKIRMK